MPTQEAISPTITLVSQDARGEIYSISLPGDRELMLLHSKKGTLRGGHSHDVAEQVMVLSGKMRYHKLYSHGAGQDILVGGESSMNHTGQIHMGEFLEDTWLIEWKIGTTRTGWKNTNYAPWREMVEGHART